jgi:hypothetical protein
MIAAARHADLAIVAAFGRGILDRVGETIEALDVVFAVDARVLESILHPPSPRKPAPHRGGGDARDRLRRSLIEPAALRCAIRSGWSRLDRRCNWSTDAYRG